jgi:hypothetical protein
MSKKTIDDLYIIITTIANDVAEIKEKIQRLLAPGGIKTPVPKKLKKSEIKKSDLKRNSQGRVIL